MKTRRRRWSCTLGVLLALAVAAAPTAALGQGGEAAGVITEIKPGRGRVEVKSAGSAEWRPARPLAALRAGDEVRATADAWAVVLLSGGRGVRVEAARSPLVIARAQAGEGRAQKARALVEASLAFLAGATRESSQAVLTTRGLTKPPVVLSPRNSPVLPGPLVVEWNGSSFSRYALRITGPAGVVLERKSLLGSRFEYPADAPPLHPSVRYTVQVVFANQAPQEAWFEVVGAGRAQDIRQQLALIEQELGAGVSPNSLVALRAGFLAREGLIHDARLSVIGALARDADEPTLHLLLGNLYAKAGLTEQAAEAHDEARFLLERGAR